MSRPKLLIRNTRLRVPRGTGGPGAGTTRHCETWKGDPNVEATECSPFYRISLTRASLFKQLDVIERAGFIVTGHDSRQLRGSHVDVDRLDPRPGATTTRLNLRLEKKVLDLLGEQVRDRLLSPFESTRKPSPFVRVVACLASRPDRCIDSLQEGDPPFAAQLVHYQRVTRILRSV